MSRSAALDDTMRDEGRPTLTRSQIAAVSLGHALEFYDFTVYGFFAVQIGRAFFPSASPWTSLFLSVAAFGVGFVMRPVGAVALGAYADRRGRKPAMLAAILLMALGTLGIALTPAYAAIGIAGPVLAVVARLLQGFAIGGEIGPSTLYLFEAAGLDRRARAMSWLFAAQGCAGTAAGLIGVSLSLSLSPAALDGWGWRVAVALGLAVVPVGLVIRARLPADRRERRLEPDAASTAGHPVARPVIGARVIVCAVLIITSGTVAFYVGAYMVSFAVTALKLPPSTSFLATVTSGVAAILVAPFGGWWADRIGRRSALVAGRVALALSAIPAFWFLVARHDAAALASIAALIAGLNALAAAPGFCLIIEALPRASRATALAIAYALGVSLFGGTTQAVVTALIAWTGEPTAPGYYLAAASLLGAGAAMAIGVRPAASDLARAARPARIGSGRRARPARHHGETYDDGTDA